jgi:murein L,D-transpeptidase YcbB/YkuD
MTEDGVTVDQMRVIVGKPEMATPLMAGTVSAITFNPFWNVPVDLAQKNIAPNVLRKGVGWLAERGYEVLASWNDPAEVIDPATVDWQAVAARKAETRIRQRPGHHNQMGGLKIAFPNELGIYLHDTPDRELFSQPLRAFSSGCVRLEDAKRLGRWLLKGREPEPLNGKPESPLALPESVPVFLTYLTAQPTADGSVASVYDIYGLDGEQGGSRVAAAN